MKHSRCSVSSNTWLMHSQGWGHPHVLLLVLHCAGSCAQLWLTPVHRWAMLNCMMCSPQPLFRLLGLCFTASTASGAFQSFVSQNMPFMACKRLLSTSAAAHSGDYSSFVIVAGNERHLGDDCRIALPTHHDLELSTHFVVGLLHIAHAHVHLQVGAESS